MHPLMNNTKWEELRLAMYGLGAHHPQWRTKTLVSGHVSEWDGEWFHHFKAGGYEDIEWVEIKIASEVQKEYVLNELRRIHVPGHETDNGFKVYGYAEPRQINNYI